MPRSRATNGTRFSVRVLFAWIFYDISLHVQGLRKKREIVELYDEGAVEGANFIVIIVLDDLWKLGFFFLMRWKLGNYIALALHLWWKIEEYPETFWFAFYLIDYY
ncbi:hypothetical protein Tco_1204879 [Tanacetum coccineum]